MTIVLGLSAFYHDSAAALLSDGVLLAAAQEERFSRIKHDASFPTQAIQFCLEQAGVSISEIDYVVFYEKPFRKLERILETYLAHAPRGYSSFRKAIPSWLKEKLFQSRVIRRGLGTDFDRRLIYVGHHEAHAASAFFPSPFEQAAILTADGVGEWATTCIGTGHQNVTRICQEMHFPDSIGILYSTFTAYAGFRVNGGEGKLMGLAPYGSPRFVEQIFETLVDLRPDGSFRLNPDYFDVISDHSFVNRKFEQLLGGPSRIPESELRQRDMDLASSVQQATETILIAIARHLRQTTGLEHLCLAGGVALNCVANTRIANESGFSKVWVQPAAGDAGGAVGAAFFVWHQLLKQSRRPLQASSHHRPPIPILDAHSQVTPSSSSLGSSAASAIPRLSGEPQATVFLGPAIDDQAILDTVQACGISTETFDSDASRYQMLARWLDQQQSLAWVQGRMEFGPRALGNRSILADPRAARTREKVNQSIKRRESFRPFAPVLIEERLRDWFELTHGSPDGSPLMTFTAMAKRSAIDASNQKLKPTKAALEATTHVDGSARVQTVSRSQNEDLYQLLMAFEQLTGCPALLNTSFNVRGEPMIASLEDALLGVLNMKLDILVINDTVIRLDAQSDATIKRIEEHCVAARMARTSKPKPSIWTRLFDGWKWLTFPIRWIVSELVLGLLFYFVFTGLGFLWRMRRKTFLPFDPKAESYWQDSPQPANDDEYFQPF